jgi:hypothetical protein
VRRHIRATAAVTGNPATTTPTPFELSVTRALDQELEWYFTYAESAKRLGSVTLLPTHEMTRLTGAPEDALLARGVELATTVQVTLGAVKTQHAGVLRALYTPRRWPVAVAREFESLAPIVVRLVCATDPWPARSSHDGLEQAAALELARALAGNGARPASLRKQAGRLMAGAVCAYARARVRVKGGVPSAAS